MTEQTERELIQGIQAHDRRALERFCSYFRERVFRIVSRMLGRHCEECRDLTMEILWGALVKIQAGQFDETKGRISQYLYGIITNTCRNYFKREKNNPEIAFSALKSSLSQNDFFQVENFASLKNHQQETDETRARETQAGLEQAIGRLEEKHKKLIFLKYYQQLSYEQISQQEGISVKKVKSRLYEARKNLEQIFRKKLKSSANF